MTKKILVSVYLAASLTACGDGFTSFQGFKDAPAVDAGAADSGPMGGAGGEASSTDDAAGAARPEDAGRVDATKHLLSSAGGRSSSSGGVAGADGSSTGGHVSGAGGIVSAGGDVGAPEVDAGSSSAGGSGTGAGGSGLAAGGRAGSSSGGSSSGGAHVCMAPMCPDCGIAFGPGCCTAAGTCGCFVIPGTCAAP